METGESSVFWAVVAVIRGGGAVRSLGVSVKMALKTEFKEKYSPGIQRKKALKWRIQHEHNHCCAKVPGAFALRRVCEERWAEASLKPGPDCKESLKLHLELTIFLVSNRELLDIIKRESQSTFT